MAAFNPASYLGFVALGLGVGAYGTLIGAGGGFVLMPVLLLLYPELPPERITSISLAVVFLNALSGSEAYARMRRIDYKSGLLFAAAAIPGAILGALNTSLVPRRLFDAVFGALLVLGAALLALKPATVEHGHHPEGVHLTTRHLVESDGKAFDYAFNPALGVGFSLVVGYVSSFLGIGGGIIHVPALVYFLNFPVHVATATSHFILVLMALTGTVVHILQGSFGHGTHHMISLAIGVVAGAQIGALLSSRLHGGWIIRSLAVALGLVGVRIMMQVW